MIKVSEKMTIWTTEEEERIIKVIQKITLKGVFLKFIRRVMKKLVLRSKRLCGVSSILYA